MGLLVPMGLPNAYMWQVKYSTYMGYSIHMWIKICMHAYGPQCMFVHNSYSQNSLYLDLLFLGSHYPTPKQIRNILKPGTSGVAVRWYDLGLQLLDDVAGPGVLELIKADHRNNNNTCCNEMFVKWLQMKPDATWNELVRALNKIGLNSVAADLKKQFHFGELY